jgi:hypothetical protein
LQNCQHPDEPKRLLRKNPQKIICKTFVRMSDTLRASALQDSEGGPGRMLLHPLGYSFEDSRQLVS